MTPQELKSSILQLAVQGRLVEQRPEEGTAEELYRQIQEEKLRLIKEGKIKKEKPLPEITEDEIPFDIPESWKWVKFGNLGSYKKGPFGSALTKSMFVPKGNGTIKVYEQKNAIQKDISLGDYYITRDYFESKMRGFEISAGDIIVSCAGTIGETYVIPDDFEQGIINQALMRMKIFQPMYIPYFLLYFDTALKRNAQSGSKGSAIKNIPPFDKLKNYLVPLPPLAEQKRIVAKIEELLPYIDRYEKAWSKLEDFNKRFPGDMQKSVLQMAIQGKLVEQRPEEGTGEELYRQIQAEKQSLIKSGKIKKEKPLPEISDDEIPFDIPESWKWAKLGDVVKRNPKNNLEDSLDVSFIPMNCVSDGYRNKHTFETRKWGQIKKGFTHFANGDIGVAKITPCFQNRKSVIFRDLINGVGAGTTELSVVRIFNETIYDKYLLWFFKSDYFISNGVKSFSGTAGQQRIDKNYMTNCLFPLPPLAEQKRIVQKLEQILPLCEKLK